MQPRATDFIVQVARYVQWCSNFMIHNVVTVTTEIEIKPFTIKIVAPGFEYQYTLPASRNFFISVLDVSGDEKSNLIIL